MSPWLPGQRVFPVEGAVAVGGVGLLEEQQGRGQETRTVDGADQVKPWQEGRRGCCSEAMAGVQREMMATLCTVVTLVAPV